MFNQWHKFKGWVILEFFLRRPNKRIHIKELARQVKVSSQSAQKYLTIYEKDRILLKEKIGNICQYSLNNENYTVRAIKKFYFLQKLSELNVIEQFTKENPSITSVTLYGSHADGTYSKQSDIDIIIISQNKKLKTESLNKLESEFGREIGLSIFTLGEWRNMVKKKKNFALLVQKNHVILFGGEI